ncbi:MAG: carboxypeptidase-like regulatory domain-containing protein [Sphingobacteriales bacterium]
MNCKTLVIGFFLILLLPSLCLAQKTFKGRVADAQTGSPLAYATIALTKQNIGVNAKQDGSFILHSKWASEDTLIVSCVGYKTLRLPIAQLDSTLDLTLNRVEKLLKPVVVKTSWRYEDLGVFKVKPIHFFTTLGNQYQVARKLSAPKAETWLQSVTIGVDGKQKASMFMVRVYDVHPNQPGPGAELTDSAILVKSKSAQIQVDLSAYLIYLPNKDFFVSVEWIQTEENQDWRTTKLDGKDSTRMYYKPYISITSNNPENKQDIWGLFYSGKWEPIKESYTLGIAIAASVRY